VSRRLAILGATGSIGSQALDVARRYPGRFKVTALTAYENAQALFDLVREFRPEAAGLAVEPESIPDDLCGCEWLFGADCAERVVRAAQPDDVLSAIVGIAGLPAALASIDCAERLLLANKEALVAGGGIVMGRAKSLNKKIIPVDSEHSAVFQCLQAADGNPLRRIILTASGGPFKAWCKRDIDSATAEDALRHPTWKMGPKITADSATMMNKGLEVIEAHHLFGAPLDAIEVTVHPESIIHSMIEFEDGAILAQMGNADMRGPISYALGCPDRLPYGGKRLDFNALRALTFEPPDMGRFPCLSLAYAAQRAGGNMPVTLNAANEAAVAAFLRGEIALGRIPDIVAAALDSTAQAQVSTVEDILAADRAAKSLAERLLCKMR
jgi:1-deoxy-D-xylulose-5-phosphate reductoisomerase